MITSLLFWLRWLVLLASLGAVSYLVIWIAWKLWNPKISTSNFGFFTWRTFLLSAGNIARKVIFAVAFGFLGWAAHDIKTNASRYSYTDVIVIDRHNDRTFTLRPARMQPWEMTACTPQNWQPGPKMKHLHFHWSPDCDDVEVRGDFEFYSDHGQRTIFPKEILNAGY